MSKQTAVADGTDLVQKKAAEDAVFAQDACNLVAIIGCWHRYLLAMHRAKICGDDLINHPVSLAFVSKLNSLCHLGADREAIALEAIERIARGETAEYEIIPL